MEPTTLAALYLAASVSLGLPTGLQSALCYVESRHNVKAINFNDGNSDSLGACQIQLQSAQFVGYKGTAKQLMSPKINIFWSARYFSYQLSRYHGDIVYAISAYNAGTARTTNLAYVRKVLKAWAENK